MSNRYKGGFITATPPTTTGGYLGTASGNWTTTQQMQAQAAGLWPLQPPPSDPYYEYVTMLLTGDGTNGAQNNTFLDSSSNAFTITRNGNTTQGSFSPYGSLWSNYFNSSTPDYLTVGTTSSFNFMHSTTAMFTFECWIYPTTLNISGAQTLFSTNDNLSTSAGVYISFDDGYLTLQIGSSSGNVINVTSTSTVSLNQWSHIAITYDQSLSSSNCKFYINGVAAGTANKTGTTPSNTNSAYAARIGTRNSASTRVFKGYLSNYRITNTIVYSSAFTPNTTPLTAISGTQLLTAQSNRFIDNSSNALAITVGGTPSVQRFSPFNPTASYSTATIGGSGYFDGSGDYLSIPSNSAFAFGTGDFTVEGWFYSSFPNTDGVRIMATAGASANIVVQVDYLGELSFWDGSSSISFTGLTAKANQWNHIAVTRSGTSLRGYINGLQSGSTQSNSTNIINNAAVNFPATTNYGANSCYLADVRYLKGTALYTSSTYTVPTAPLTAITNTSLLCNMTNAGIPDSAMMNDLETVGNAQVSTSVKKYGTGSLAFDGTGDWLLAPSSPNYQFSTGDATVEAWIYPTSVSGTQVFVDMRVGSASGIALYLNDSTLSVAKDIGTVLQSGGTVSANTWNHVAWCRSGSTNKLFLNGTVVSTVTDSTNYPNAPVYVGCSADAYQPYTGYIDDLRITKGYARYTANFTPPTEAFPTY